jgi:hypothetical protein
MHCLSVVAVDDAFVDGLWKKVAPSGSYYSIGDGVCKATFRRVFFESALVLSGNSVVIRFENHKDYVELHPIVMGQSAFRHAKEIVEDASSACERLFAKMPVCCIIPDGMRGAKRLAEVAGFTQKGYVERNLSGVMLRCSVFVKRSAS